MKPWVWIAVLVLALLHQDWWLWNDDAVVGGFLPVGLAYHALYSLVATGLWLLVAWHAWPEALDDEPEESP